MDSSRVFYADSHGILVFVLCVQGFEIFLAKTPKKIFFKRYRYGIAIFI